MVKPVDIIQSDPEVPVGVFGELLSEWQVPFRILRPDLGETLPAVADAVVVLGGAMGVHDMARHPFLREVKACMGRMLAAGTPLFGVCLGGQLLADVAGGEVSSNRCGERGLVDITLTATGAADPLFAGIGRGFRAFQWHNDSFSTPPGAQHLAASSICPGQAFRIGRAWGVQFHPEVDAAIVAAWSRADDPAGGYVEAFSAAAAVHERLARRLLANFIAIVTD